MGDVIPEQPENAIDADAITVTSIGQEPEFDDGDALGDVDPDEESILSNHEGATADEDTGGLLDGGAVSENDEPHSDEDGDEPDGDGEGVQLRRSKRKRRVTTRLDGFEHNMFATYSREGAEEEVDEYMHATLSEDKCNEMDSYLVPVFEFIITQYSLKAGLRKAKGKDKKQIRDMMHQHMMTQYSLKTGLRKFGQQGEAAVTKELGQFHDMSVFVPMDPTKLTKEERAAALASLIFLKQKKDGSVKARACADGRKQRKTMAQEDAASPTVSIESIFMSCAIDASEGRDVAIIDLPGAFLHADCTDHVIMRFQGRLAELMVLAAPQIYRKYVTTGANGELVLFVKLQKALYGMLK
jgi:hypothetical protein